MIEDLPSYSSVPVTNENKLYLCHDMKGGYKEDVFFDHNIVGNSKIQNMAYRTLHLEQS